MEHLNSTSIATEILVVNRTVSSKAGPFTNKDMNHDSSHLSEFNASGSEITIAPVTLSQEGLIGIVLISNLPRGLSISFTNGSLIWMEYYKKMVQIG